MSVSVESNNRELDLCLCVFFPFHFSNNSSFIYKIKLLHNHWYVSPTLVCTTVFQKDQPFLTDFKNYIYISLNELY